MGWGDAVGNPEDALKDAKQVPFRRRRWAPRAKKRCFFYQQKPWGPP